VTAEQIIEVILEHFRDRQDVEQKLNEKLSSSTDGGETDKLLKRYLFNHAQYLVVKSILEEIGALPE
jgi:hypothetical protein